MFLSPLSLQNVASFPQVLVSSEFPPVLNPILESHRPQFPSLFPMMPILALRWPTTSLTVLNPSLLQLTCNEVSKPISDFHVSRPNEVSRYWAGVPADRNEFGLAVNHHTEANLREGCVPVGGKFGLIWVEPSLPSIKVKSFVVAPKGGIVVKRLLWWQQNGEYLKHSFNRKRFLKVLIHKRTSPIKIWADAPNYL